MLRVPVAAGAQRTLATELALVPDLATALPVSVPRFEHVARDGDTLLLAGYRLLPGAPLSHDRLTAMGGSERRLVLDRLAAFLEAVHAYPVDRATAAGVRAELVKGGYHPAQHRLPRLLQGTLTPAEVGRLEALLGDHERQPMVVLHADLKPEHVLYDERTRGLAVIDWGDVSLGEPGFDLAIIGRFFGQEFLRALLERMPGLDADLVLQRARFYQLLRDAQDLRYAERTGNHAWIPASAERLRAALAGYDPPIST